MKALAVSVVFLWGVLWLMPTPAMAQDCGQVRDLLRQGNSVAQISRATGLSIARVQACAQLRQQRRLRSPQGLPAAGAAGPAPFGAAGPPPLGAAGPPPLGAAGPPPVGH